jgi:hypothetical protein
MLALERPDLGPATLHRFPPRLRAAVREVLHIARHGQVLQPGELSTEQLSLLCSHRRQQLFEEVKRQEIDRQGGAAGSQRPSAGPGDPEVLYWAMQQGWELPQLAAAKEKIKQELLLTGAGGEPAPSPSPLSSGARPRATSPHLVKPATCEDDRLPQSSGEASHRKTREVATGGRGPVAALKELERRLERRLMAGGMAAPRLPTAPHPLHSLPKELLLRILQLAAYPLSVWAEGGDFELLEGEVQQQYMPGGALMSDGDDSGPDSDWEHGF